MTGRRAVFLDRDGVLVRPVRHSEKVYGPLTLDKFELLPDIGEPVRRLRDAGFVIVLATNQPGIARGHVDWATLNEMHRRLCEVVTLDAIRVCPHTDADCCECRKPKAGLLLDAAQELNLDLAGSYFVGDTDRDIGAARAAGVTPILIDAPYNRGIAEVHRVADLAEAARWITA